MLEDARLKRKLAGVHDRTAAREFKGEDEKEGKKVSENEHRRRHAATGRLVPMDTTPVPMEPTPVPMEPTPVPMEPTPAHPPTRQHPTTPGKWMATVHLAVADRLAAHNVAAEAAQVGAVPDAFHAKRKGTPGRAPPVPRHQPETLANLDNLHHLRVVVLGTQI